MLLSWDIILAGRKYTMTSLSEGSYLIVMATLEAHLKFYYFGGFVLVASITASSELYIIYRRVTLFADLLVPKVVYKIGRRKGIL